MNPVIHRAFAEEVGLIKQAVSYEWVHTKAIKGALQRGMRLPRTATKKDLMRRVRSYARMLDEQEAMTRAQTVGHVPPPSGRQKHWVAHFKALNEVPAFKQPKILHSLPY